MFGKGMLGRNESLEIVVAILAAAGADARPFRIGGGGIVIADAGTGLIAIFREHIVEPGAELVLERAAAGGQIISRPFGALAVRAIRLRRLIGSRDFSRVRARRLVLRPLEQRIAFQLLLDISREIETRELQQLDGLHQLRRHHQRLALAELQFGGQCHESPFSAPARFVHVEKRE